MANTFKGLRSDGRLPSEAEAQVRDLISTEAPAPDLSAYPTTGEVEELIAESTGGGFYVNADGEQVPYVMVASDEEPPTSMVIDGRTYEVWWVQTTPPDPNAWVPKLVTASLSGRSYTVPADAGATYTVGGVTRVAGNYAVTTAAQTLAWAAKARPGYTFAPGAVTSGSLVFPEKTFAPGDVLMSDSFNRADGPLVGSTSDSFEGGSNYTWVSSMGNGGIVGGAVKPSETFFRPTIGYAYPQQNVRVEFAWKVYGAQSEIVLKEGTNPHTVAIRRSSLFAKTADGNKGYTPNLPTEPSPGDHIAVYTQTTPDGYRQWFMENITKNQKVTSTTAPASGNVFGGVLDNSGIKFTNVEVSLRGDDTPKGELDWIKVVQA